MIVTNGKGIHVNVGDIVVVELGILPSDKCKFVATIENLTYNTHNNKLVHAALECSIEGNSDYVTRLMHNDQITFDSTYIQKIVKHGKYIKKLPHNIYRHIYSHREIVYYINYLKGGFIEHMFSNVVRLVLNNNDVHCPHLIDFGKLSKLYEKDGRPGTKSDGTCQLKKVRKWVLKNYHKAIPTLKERVKKETAEQEKREREYWEMVQQDFEDEFNKEVIDDYFEDNVLDGFYD